MSLLGNLVYISAYGTAEAYVKVEYFKNPIHVGGDLIIDNETSILETLVYEADNPTNPLIFVIEGCGLVLRNRFLVPSHHQIGLLWEMAFSVLGSESCLPRHRLHR